VQRFHALGSCAARWTTSYARGFFNAYARLAARGDLDCIVHLGDYIYEYAAGEYADEVRAHAPAHETVSLTDYRTRHAQYKTDPDLQELHRQHPMIAIWDDHETADNAWRDGAANHQAHEGGWDARVDCALRAYYEWMPVRTPQPGSWRQRYREFRFGNLARLLILETRLLARDAQPDFNHGNFAELPGGSQLLGAQQEQWLIEQLHKPDVRWRLLGQGVMMSQFKLHSAANASGASRYVNPDLWDGYPSARSRLFKVLQGDGQSAPIDNVVVLSGDIHSSWAADLTMDPGNPDVASGGYDPRSGAGSLAVEYVTTSVTSPGAEGLPWLATLARSLNPQLKFAEVTQRGYLLLDITPQRVSGEWWYVDTVRLPSHRHSFGAAYEVLSGHNCLQPGRQSAAPDVVPFPAPTSADVV